LYSHDERRERCYDAALALALSTDIDDPGELAREAAYLVFRTANDRRGNERPRLELTDSLDELRSQQLEREEKQGRARRRRRARPLRDEWTIIEPGEQYAACRAVLAMLTEAHQRVLWDVAGDKTLAQIAKDRGVGKPAVSMLWNRAREEFARRYYRQLGLPMPRVWTRPRRRRHAS
jgi:hypothetical protein